MKRPLTAIVLTVLVGSVGGVLTAQAPASAAVTGATVASEQTAFNAESPKVARARCPEGKRVTGGFGRVTGNTGHVLLTRMEPVHTNAQDRFDVAAFADETDPTNQWAVTAVAICADPLPGQQIFDLTANATPGAKGQSANVSCPGDRLMIGSGGRIDGGRGEVHLSRTGPATESSVGQASAAGTTDSTGFGGAWSVTAYVVCARVAAADLARPAEDSDLNSASPKAAPVACPAGMFVTGGGGNGVNDATGNVVIQSMMPDVLPGGIPGDEATLTMRENNPIGGNWLARARLHCAR